MPEGMRGQCEAALPTPVNWRLPCVYPHNTKFSGHVTSGTRPYKFSRAWGRGYGDMCRMADPTFEPYGGGEVLFPGLDLDSGLDWTLDWTLEKMYFRCHCSAKEARGPMPCPLEAQTLNHVHISR